MTNDGAFANTVTHPSKHVPKTYRVITRPGVTEDQLTQTAIGIVVDGQRTVPANVYIISQEPGRTMLEIVLCEGHNHEIRKVYETLGLDIAHLKRTVVGLVCLETLQLGQRRNLTGEKAKRLMVVVREGKAIEPEPKHPKAAVRPTARRNAKFSSKK